MLPVNNFKPISYNHNSKQQRSNKPAFTSYTAQEVIFQESLKFANNSRQILSKYGEVLGQKFQPVLGHIEKTLQKNGLFIKSREKIVEIQTAGSLSTLVRMKGYDAGLFDKNGNEIAIVQKTSDLTANTAKIGVLESLLKQNLLDTSLNSVVQKVVSAKDELIRGWKSTKFASMDERLSHIKSEYGNLFPEN